MIRLPYDSDVNDQEWACIAPHVQQKSGPGRKRTIDIREVINALCYMSKTGWTQRVPRRMLPHDLPPWQHVAYYYYQWINDGRLEQSNDCLREEIRIERGKDPEPSVAIMDSQSVKTVSHGEERGYDSGNR